MIWIDFHHFIDFLMICQDFRLYCILHTRVWACLRVATFSKIKWSILHYPLSGYNVIDWPYFYVFMGNKTLVYHTTALYFMYLLCKASFTMGLRYRQHRPSVGPGYFTVKNFNLNRIFHSFFAHFSSLIFKKLDFFLIFVLIFSLGFYI